MRKVLKSYMISFIKAWVETVGTILFLLMLCAIVLGMLTTPLQINAKVGQVKGSCSNPDYYLKANSYNLTSDFLYNYFISGMAKDDEGINTTADDHLTYNFDGAKKQYEIKDENISYKDVFWFNDASITGDDYLTSDEYTKFLSDNNLPTNFDFEKISTNTLQDPNSEIFFKLMQSNLNATIYKAIEDVQYSPTNTASVFSNTFLENIYNVKKTEGIDYLIKLLQPALTQTTQFDWNYTFTYAIGQAPNMKTFDIAPLQDDGNSISQVKLLEGRLPNKDTGDDKTIEVVISSAYYKGAKIKLNSTVATIGDYKLKAVGVGMNYETISNGGGFSIFNGSDVDSYGYIYLTHNNINRIYESANAKNSSSITNLNILVRVKSSDDLGDYFIRDNENDKGVLLGSGQSWETSSKYSPIHSLQNIRIQVIIYMVLGMIILVLAFVFLNFIIKKELNQSRVQIGIFKAMGYTRGQLSWVFALKTLLTLAAGIILGYIVSIPLQQYAAGQFDSSVAISFDAIYASPVFLTVLFIGVPLVFMGISYLLTLRDLRESSLELMNNSVRMNNPNYFLIIFSVILFPCGIVWLLNKMAARLSSRSGRHFTWRMQYSFTSSGRGKFVMVIGLIAFSSFMFMALISASTVMNSLISEGFSSINANADYRLIWDKKNDMVVKKDGDTNKLVLDDKYATDKWKPADLEYVDYSAKGLEETAKEYLDMASADQITSLFSNAITYFDNDSELDNSALSQSEDFNINARALAAYFAMMFTDISLDQTDQTKAFNDLSDILVNLDLNDLATVAPFLSYLNDSKDNNPNSWFWLQKQDKQPAFRMKDFAKLGCEVTSMMVPAGQASSCNDLKAWQTMLQSMSGDTSGTDDNSSSSQFNMDGGLFGSLYGIASMLDMDDSYNPLITTNTYLYDKTKDFLYYAVAGSEAEDQNIGDPYFRLVNTKDGDKYGSIDNGFNLDSNARSKLNNLGRNSASEERNSEDNPIDSVVSYRFAKGTNSDTGDVVRVYIGNTIKVPVYIKIIAVDYNDTFVSNMTVDSDTFLNQVLDSYGTKDKTDLLGSNNVIFNAIVSQNTAMVGDIDLKNIAESMKSIQVKAPVFNVATENGTALGDSIMNQVLKGFVNNDKFLGAFNKFTTAMAENADQDVQLLNNVSISGIAAATTNSNSIAEFTPFKITQALVNQISDIATMMMSIFIVLDAVLLLIILVVIMNIVVDESTRIILTMRAIGYKNRRVNWMVMGNYIIWTIVGFIIAYIFIVILWAIVGTVVWAKFSILIGIPMTPEIPLIALAVVAAIMLAGWLAAMHRINTSKLTNITD